MAQQAATNSAAFPATTVIFLIAGTVFVLGYRIAVARRANKDYKTTKAALPKLRRAFWSSAWAALKFGFWVFIAGSLLIAWVAHDVREAAAR